MMILDDGMISRFFTLQSSVEKSARIGTCFLKAMIGEGKASHFRERLAEHAEAINSSQYSSTKIGAHLISIIVMGALCKHYGKRKWKVGLVVVVLAPALAGLARYLGICACRIIPKNKERQLPPFPLDDQKHQVEREQRWWEYYALWCAGEGRVFENAQDLE